MNSQGNPAPRGIRFVDSLLDAMEDGNEYGSIVGCVPRNANTHDFDGEIRTAIREVERVRGRPAICYVANSQRPNASIDGTDLLPFTEMVGRVPKGDEVDVIVVTPGGSMHTVAQFVDQLRRRFKHVAFLVPAQAMSAGTLWVLSGDEIWMTSRAYLGPIDPQVPNRQGMLLPAQALLELIRTIQDDGETRRAKGQLPQWTHVQMIQNLDLKEVGHAMSASKYAVDLGAQFVETYKFRGWTTHASTGNPVTPEERASRAKEVAGALCSHAKWKAHGHAINRDTLWEEIRVKIDRPETVSGLERALHRLWALIYYVFDKLPLSKLIVSPNYQYARFSKEAP